jgi:hypothetical protein
MSQFERDLRECLRRREPPLGFTGRVLARARDDERGDLRSAWRRSWGWATVVTMVVMLFVGDSLYQMHRRRLQAEQSKEQLMVALRVTGSKLQLIQARLEKKTIQIPLQQ